MLLGQSNTIEKMHMPEPVIRFARLGGKKKPVADVLHKKPE